MELDEASSTRRHPVVKQSSSGRSRLFRSRSRSPPTNNERCSNTSLMSVDYGAASSVPSVTSHNQHLVSSVTNSGGIRGVMENRSSRPSSLMDVEFKKLLEKQGGGGGGKKESRSRSRSPPGERDRAPSVSSSERSDSASRKSENRSLGSQSQLPAGMMTMMPQGAAPILMQYPAGMGMVPIMMLPQGNMFPSAPFAAPATAAIPSTSKNLTSAADKVNRELFVGNTPPGTSEQLLIQFLNGAMQRTNLCAPYHKPIIHCRVNTKFAFVECASVNDANSAMNLNGIPFLGMNLRISRPSKYAGPHVPSKTWQELTGQKNDPNPPSESNTEVKVNLELFIGNTTPEMTEQSLTDFLGKAMQQVGLTKAPGNPITACRASGKFAFVELRSVEETNNALNLNNIPYMGIQLKVRRPSKYVGPETDHGNWEDLLSKYMLGELQLPAKSSTGGGDASVASGVSNGGPSRTRVVELRNMLTSDDLDSDQDYNEIMEDTKDECSQFGDLKNIIIPRSGLGATKIFLEYNTSEDAAKAIKALAGRTFDGRTIDASFMDEEKYWRKDYSD